MGNSVRWLLRGIVAAVLLVSAGVKLAEPYEFYDSILGYRLIGPALARTMVTALPAAEILLAGLLLTGLALRAGAVGTGVLGLIFVAAQASTLARGIETGCGCFGAASGSIGVGSLLRATAITASGFLIARFDKPTQVDTNAASTPHSATP